MYIFSRFPCKYHNKCVYLRPKYIKVKNMCRFSESSKQKLGNAVVFIAERARFPYKTEVLKLLYLMEEQMVLKYHVPLLAIPFSVWRMGPVSVDVYEELSDQPILLESFVTLKNTGKGNIVKPKVKFDDGEFSDAELEVMDNIMSKYGTLTSDQLIELTHREGSPWWNAAKENDLLQDFKEKRANSSNVVIDFGKSLCNDNKAFYEECLEVRRTANMMRP